MRNLGLLAAALVLIGPLLAYLSLVQPFHGFLLFALGGLLAVLVAIGAIIGLARGRSAGAGGLAGIVVAIVFVGLIVRGGGHPRINDFTTDPTDPPAMRGAASIPENAGRDLAYPAGFADQQRACCADLAPVELPLPPADAFVRVRQVAETMPWTITNADPQAGIVEAVAMSGLFHFRDDIVIRVRPLDGGKSRVDMRSKSRDGQGDFGVNAARIRSYMTALRATS